MGKKIQSLYIFFHFSYRRFMSQNPFCLKWLCVVSRCYTLQPFLSNLSEKWRGPETKKLDKHQRPPVGSSISLRRAHRRWAVQGPGATSGWDSHDDTDLILSHQSTSVRAGVRAHLYVPDGCCRRSGRPACHPLELGAASRCTL